MSQDELPMRQGFTLTGRHVLAMVTLFFAAVIAADVGMVTMAYRTFSGEVARDPYEAGLLYNRTLVEHRAQDALGWTAMIDREQDGRIAVRVKTRSGQPVGGLKVSVTLERPATETGRAVLDAKPETPGLYTVRPGSLDGAWDARVRATDAQGHTFQAERRLMLP